MRNHCLLLGLLILGLHTQAQDTLAGYAKTVRGETIGYNSYTPMATQALLARTNTGDMVMEWETDAVPANYKGDTVYFSWVGSNASGTLAGEAPFDLSIENQYALTITLNKDYNKPGWLFTNRDGVSVRFQKLMLDQSNDMSGKVTLAVPKNLLTPGQPLHLKITGQKKNTQDWFMVFQYRISDHFKVEVLPLLEKSTNGDTLRVLRIYGAYKKPTGTLKLKSQSEAHDFTLHEDYNELEWAVPYHHSDKEIKIQLTLDGETTTDTLPLEELLPLELHLVHHSHTDIGYSNLQPEVASIQIRNIRQAMALIQKTKDYPVEARFRWNIESLWAVENFLDSAKPEEVSAFQQALATGRMVPQAFYANELTGLLDGEELTWLTAYARTLEKQFDIHIRSAMITDVPGYTWSTIQALQEAGVRYFSIGPNQGDRIGGVIRTWGDKPFYWETPGGGKVLVDVAGSSYSWFHGTPGARDPIRLRQRLLAYVRHLNEEKYPYFHALVRYNIVSDNAPLDTGISDFIRAWNEKYLYPKLYLSTPEIALHAIEQDYGAKIPVLKGDMSPYWEDGAASTAMELGWNRQVRARLEQTEALAAMLKTPTKDWYSPWRGVIMFDEHTWGAWSSITDPDNPFTTYQWQFKRRFLEVADSLGNALRASVLAPYTDGSLRALNTHSWDMSGELKLPDIAKNELVTDSAGKPFPQQALSNGSRIIYLKNVPAYKSVLLKIAPGQIETSAATITGYTIENGHLQMRIDSTNGAIASIQVKGKEIIDQGPLRLNQYEYVPGRDPGTALGARLKDMQVTENGPLLTVIRLRCEAPGARDLRMEYRLNNLDGCLTIVDSIDKELVRTKEAVHFAFPFSIPGATLTADNGAFPYRPFEDTLAGGNRDFGYVGKWMDLSGPEGGILLCPEETPIMEWGSMRSEVIAPGSSVSAWKTTFAPTQTWYSYAMNNYWHTNYKADQEGWAVFTYRLLPHGPINLVSDYETAEAFEAPLVLLQTTKPIQPLLHLGNPNAVVSTLQPLEQGYWIQVYNPTDKSIKTTISAGNKKIYLSNAHQDRLSLLGDDLHRPAPPVDPVPRWRGPITLEPYQKISLLIF